MLDMLLQLHKYTGDVSDTEEVVEDFARLNHVSVI